MPSHHTTNGSSSPSPPAAAASTANAGSSSTPLPSQVLSTRWPEDVGILAIEMYFPNQFVDQSKLEEADGVGKGKYTIGLGQQQMGFVDDNEDIQSICLTVVKNLLDKSSISASQIGFMMVGTETIIDKSKSVKSTLMQLFEESGNSDVEGLDTTNACYGGTAALFHAINWVESSSWDGRYALVVCGDLAVYATGPARPTGGAGACAMLIGANAPLVFVRGARATTMWHDYDFYKPQLSCEYPVVDGKKSVVCYTKAVDRCYRSLCEKLSRISLEKQISLSYFHALIFHSPYCKLVQKSVGRLAYNDFKMDSNPDYENKYSKDCEKFRDMDAEESYTNRDLEKYFVDHSKPIFAAKTQPSLMLASRVGNMYTASLYSGLVSHLCNTPIEQLVSQRLLLFSYGSGVAASMYVLSVTHDISDKSPLRALLANLQHVRPALDSRIEIEPAEYAKILAAKEAKYGQAPLQPQASLAKLRPGTYYLTGIDKEFRRTYSRVASAAATTADTAAAAATTAAAPKATNGK